MGTHRDLLLESGGRSLESDDLAILHHQNNPATPFEAEIVESENVVFHAPAPLRADLLHRR